METEGEVVKRVEYEFPKLRDERLNSVLATVNTEPKNITLAFCIDEQPKTYSDLGNEFIKSVDIENHWVPSEHTFGVYSHYTFVPIGMVAEEIIRVKGRLNPVRHWRETKEGKKYGQPIAAFSLKYAVDQNCSLYKNLGSTASTGDLRAPFTRSEVLRVLYEDDMELNEIVDKLKIDDSSIQRNIRSLKKAGLIEYDSVSSDIDEWAEYKWVKGKPNQVKTVGNLAALTKEVAEFLYKNKKTNRVEIAKNLDYKHPANISKILVEMEKECFIKPIKWFKEHRSEGKMTHKGKKFFEDYITPVRNALDDKEELNEMKDILHDFENNFLDRRVYCNRAMDLYEKVSPALKRRSKEERKLDVLFAINWFNKQKKGARPTQIEKKMVLINVGYYISPLLKDGLIYKKKEGNKAYYFLTEEGKKMV